MNRAACQLSCESHGSGMPLCSRVSRWHRIFLEKSSAHINVSVQKDQGCKRSIAPPLPFSPPIPADGASAYPRSYSEQQRRITIIASDPPPRLPASHTEPLCEGEFCNSTSLAIFLRLGGFRKQLLSKTMGKCPRFLGFRPHPQKVFSAETGAKTNVSFTCNPSPYSPCILGFFSGCFLSLNRCSILIRSLSATSLVRGFS